MTASRSANPTGEPGALPTHRCHSSCHLVSRYQALMPASIENGCGDPLRMLAGAVRRVGSKTTGAPSARKDPQLLRVLRC